jgi:tocopherol cyclase
MLKILKPTTLRGNLERNTYFEGWFQKIYSKEYNSSFVIIYGYATRNSEDTFGFIQILFPNNATEVSYFNRNEFSCDQDHHIIRMGENTLTTEFIQINTNDVNIRLNFLNNHVTRTFKNSMGYNYFIPNLPCYHAVLNTGHLVSGEIKQKDKRFIIENELGYLEKNWGTSFPKTYYWLHALDPNDPQVSLLFSRAEIEWMGKKFIRHLGHLRYNDKQVDIRSLKNFNVSIISSRKDKHEIRIASKTLQIEISITHKNNVCFKGPFNGKLSRDIIHFPDSIIQIRLSENNKIRMLQLVGNFENLGSF